MLRLKSPGDCSVLDWTRGKLIEFRPRIFVSTFTAGLGFGSTDPHVPSTDWLISTVLFSLFLILLIVGLRALAHAGLVAGEEWPLVGRGRDFP
jgi:hypothetical protein